MIKKAGIVLGVFIVFILIINWLVLRSVQEPKQASLPSTPMAQVTKTDEPTPQIQVQPRSSDNQNTKNQMPCQTITRRNYVVPGNEYEESLFFCDGKEIAKQTIVNGEVKDQRGTIPDGKIQVVDSYRNSSGEEFYKDGKRSGKTKFYYDSGALQKEITYEEGKIIMSKEYFNTGQLYIEQDFRDAISLIKDNEVGVGKIYYDTGTLRYEWNLTNHSSKGFKKAYNSDGELVMEKYYNSFGQLIEQPKNTSPQTR